LFFSGAAGHPGADCDKLAIFSAAILLISLTAKWKQACFEGGVMTTIAPVPAFEAPQPIRLVKRVETPETLGDEIIGGTAASDAACDARPCVFLAALRARESGEIARRISAALGPKAVDVTGLAEPRALLHLHGANAVFLVSSTDWLCLELAAEWSRWLGSHGLAERCGLVLWHVPGGATAEHAEERTGLPVCALLHREEHVGRFTRWIAAEQWHPGPGRPLMPVAEVPAGHAA
jgi:hypothetical protein